MCNELRKVYVMALCPILRHYAMCPPAYIYNCVGLYRHTQVYIYIIYNIIIFISMPFYMGIDINIFTRMRTARAREASNSVIWWIQG